VRRLRWWVGSCARRCTCAVASSAQFVWDRIASARDRVGLAWYTTVWSTVRCELLWDIKTSYKSTFIPSRRAGSTDRKDAIRRAVNKATTVEKKVTFCNNHVPWTPINHNFIGTKSFFNILVDLFILNILTLQVLFDNVSYKS